MLHYSVGVGDVSPIIRFSFSSTHSPSLLARIEYTQTHTGSPEAGIGVGVD